MSATSYGLGTTEYTPHPDFSARRGSDGAWSGSQTFSMLRGTWESTARQTFTKGAPATALFVELDTYWSFLELEDFEVRAIPGGVVEVSCQFTGWSSAEYDEDEDVTYTLAGTRVERSILLHPLFIHETAAVEAQDLVRFEEAYNKMWRVVSVDDDRAVFISTSDAIEKWEINQGTGGGGAALPEYTELLKWFRVIWQQGHRTYKAPTLTWTCETSSKSGWGNADLDKLALVEFDIDNPPPGNPPHPQFGFWEWMKVSMNQSESSGRAIQSQTWELSPPDGFHRFPGEGLKGKGIYNWDHSQLLEAPPQ